MAFCELYRTWPGSQWKKGRGKGRTQESENVRKDPHKSAFIETCECCVRINLCGHNLGILIFIGERGELSETIFIFLYDKKKQEVYINTSYGLHELYTVKAFRFLKKLRLLSIIETKISKV